MRIPDDSGMISKSWVYRRKKLGRDRFFLEALEYERRRTEDSQPNRANLDGYAANRQLRDLSRFPKRLGAGLMRIQRHG